MVTGREMCVVLVGLVLIGMGQLGYWLADEGLTQFPEQVRWLPTTLVGTSLWLHILGGSLAGTVLLRRLLRVPGRP